MKLFAKNNLFLLSKFVKYCNSNFISYIKICLCLKYIVKIFLIFLSFSAFLFNLAKWLFYKTFPDEFIYYRNDLRLLNSYKNIIHL